jgi:tetratricopeptide (TPR) repeat protein
LSGITRTFKTIILIALISGCATMGSVGTHIRGSYYLDRGDYQKGLNDFTDRVKESPDDSTANYYQGRFLLALDRPGEALPYLKKATTLSPNNSETWFWLGVGYWGVMDFSNERAAYKKVIDINPTHIPAHVYLAHNYLDAGQKNEALKQYEAALKLDEYQPEAFYGKAMALKELGRSKEEVKAWKEYLKYYPDGSLGRDAALNLNERGDFTYRNHQIGLRMVTLDWIYFEPGTSNLKWEAKPSLKVVGNILDSYKKFDLVIESYYRDKPNLAQARGDAVKNYILEEFPHVTPQRLSVRSIGRPERVKAGRKIYVLNGSIVFKTKWR